MKRAITLTFLLLSQFAFANYTYEYEQEIVQLKCDGQIDKFIVNLTSYINPKDMKVMKSKIELGYKVEVWSSPAEEETFTLVPNIQGSYVGIEASVEGNSANYTMSVPQWGNYSWSEKSTSFKTDLTLKAGLINGNLAVDCQATLEKAKISKEHSY